MHVSCSHHHQEKKIPHRMDECYGCEGGCATDFPKQVSGVGGELFGAGCRRRLLPRLCLHQNLWSKLQTHGIEHH